VAGSLVERVDDDPSGRGRNTSVHIGPDGADRGVYRKLHLFDVEVAGEVYRESDGEAPGQEIVVSELADGTGLGLTVCYDLRFPELFRILTLRGARVVSLPAAFTAATTRDHWQILVRARAIEDQVFVVAANQVGEHLPGRASGGLSMIVDPWGRVLDALDDRHEGFAIADLDIAAQDDIRAKLPSLDHRRPDVYEWPAGLPSGARA
jgi:predicted amidohydrolase